MALWKLFCEAAMQDPGNPLFHGINAALAVVQQPNVAAQRAAEGQQQQGLC